MWLRQHFFYNKSSTRERKMYCWVSHHFRETADTWWSQDLPWLLPVAYNHMQHNTCVAYISRVGFQSCQAVWLVLTKLFNVGLSGLLLLFFFITVMSLLFNPSPASCRGMVHRSFQRDLWSSPGLFWCCSFMPVLQYIRLLPVLFK